MNHLQIGDFRIGDEFPPFVMAEAGINHDGHFDRAIQMVDAAVAAGASCIKFQCHITEAEMIPTDMKPGKISDERLWDIIKRCELTEEEEVAIQKHCREKGILYLCTPFSREASDRLARHGVAAYKIGSGECNNLPLIRHIAAKGLPMIVSTGMNGMEAIAATVDAIRKLNCPFMLMHCTSAYPAAYEHIRLGAISELKAKFGVPVGLSDHSIGIYTALGSIAAGACMVEKHFTISRSWPGPDNPMSIEPAELTDLVKGTRAVFQALGGSKTVLALEQPVIDFAYASVVTIKPVRAGEILSLENIWVKRPGLGAFKAKDLEAVIGRKAVRSIAADTYVTPEDLA